MSAYDRRRWAYPLLARAAGPVCRFGSLEWTRLPDNHPDKLASAIVAALAWASEADDLEETLRAQVEAERLAFKRAEDEDYTARRDAWRRNWDADVPAMRADPSEGDRIEQEFREWVERGDAA